VVTETAPGVDAEVVLHAAQTTNSIVDGIAADVDGQLLLTWPEGIVRINPATGAADWAVPIPGCRRSALMLPDRSILALNGSAVLRWHHDDVQIVAGGFTGGSCLLSGPNNESWVFDFKGRAWLPFGTAVTLTQLGNQLGMEDRHAVDFQAEISSAVWLSQRRFYLAGNGHFGVVDLDSTTTVPIDDRLISPHPDQRGAVRLDERTVLTASRHGTVYRIDVENGQNTCVAKLDMLALGCDMASGAPDTAYVLEHRGSAREFIPLMVKLTGIA
jgi:hypothetical protein